MKAERSAVASIEFGILCPVLAILLMGMTDLSLAIIRYRLLNNTVQQVGLMATQLSVQSDHLTALTVSQLNQASSVIFAIFPALVNAGVWDAQNIYPPYAVTVSDVVFTPTKTGCVGGLDCTAPYNANLAWSVPLIYGQHLQRSCGSVNQLYPADAPTYDGNLATSVPTKGISKSLVSTLVVDGMYQYTPIFGRFLGTITMRQTALFNQRSIVAHSIKYNIDGKTSGGVVCAGVS